MNNFGQMKQVCDVMHRRADAAHERLVKNQVSKQRIIQTAEVLIAKRDALGLDRATFSHAVARFMFLSKFVQLKDAVNFVTKYFGKTISPSQLSRNLRNVLDFEGKFSSIDILLKEILQKYWSSGNNVPLE